MFGREIPVFGKGMQKVPAIVFEFALQILFPLNLIFHLSKTFMGFPHDRAFFHMVLIYVMIAGDGEKRLGRNVRFLTNFSKPTTRPIKLG